MYQRILVPIDGSVISNCGLSEAIRIAKMTQGRLRLFHVIDDLSFALALGSNSGISNDLIASLRGDAMKILDKAKAVACAAGVQVETRLCDAFRGEVQDKVAEEAREWGADLIVLSTHGRRGASRLLLGSGAERILRVAPVPILLVRAPDTTLSDEVSRATTSALAAAE
ncbi:universal stress protein [Variovorax sp. Sphag1AA]|uniref:universal stress protein n=1 Tax=Variovorax sp. Sphag1AA TaxID=2587027 RepID=UPI00161BAC01|nr:universal stress protein [Variovorax sp. Sphag1AA]MBB3181969.1 nucleotide-binding universal stress UspA family protein [Variovorax sp. Sphag1AA]